MLKILKVFSRILDVVTCDGKKRFKLAIENVFYMVFAVVCAWGAYELIDYVNEISANGCTCEDAGMGALAILGILICIGTGIYTLIAGIASQLVLLVCALLGSILSTTRGKNFAAFIIALLSLAVCVVGGLFLFGII